MTKMVNEVLIKDFVAGGRDHLSAIKPDLSAMEEYGAGVDPKVVDNIFRAVHSIKESAVFLGLEAFNRLSHAMENILSRIRDGEMYPSGEVIDGLLAGADRLAKMIEEIAAGDEPAGGKEITRLDELLADHALFSPEDPVAPRAARPDPVASTTLVGRGDTRLDVDGGAELGTVSFAVSGNALGETLESGLHLFALWVHQQRDLSDRKFGPAFFRTNLESIGQLLADDLDPLATGYGHCLLATLIEEPQIVAVACELPPRQVVELGHLDPRTAGLPIEQDQADPQPALVPQSAPSPPDSIQGQVQIRVKADAGRDALSLVVDRAQVSRAKEGAHYLYAVWINAEQDLAAAGSDIDKIIDNIESVGTVLAMDLGHQARGVAAWYHLLVGTLIEESEIAAAAFELDPAQVVKLSAEVLKSARTHTRTKPTRPKPDRPALPGLEPTPPPLPKAPAIKGPKAPETIRVGVELVDNLINLAGELVLGRNQLKRLLENEDDRQSAVKPVMQGVDLVTSDLQEQIMRLRMQPVGKLFNKFPRVVRDLSRQVNKRVRLEMHGSEVELDKSILEQLSDPLTHLVRNCVDHGLELPDRRAAMGKPPAGKIELRAFHQEGQVIITVADDGRGIDAQKVADSAVAAGLVDEEDAGRMSEGEKLRLITLPGLSTADEVTDISGRGVGMDVVSTNIAKVGGQMHIESEVGLGTTMRLRLPLTLAIIPCLVVGAGGQVFAIPQADVRELYRVQAADSSTLIGRVGKAPVLRLRQRLLPLVRLSDLLGMDRLYTDSLSGHVQPDRRERITDRRLGEADAKIGGASEAGGRAKAPGRRGSGQDRRHRHAGDINVVVLRMGANRFGLIVEDLFDTEEIVVKPLSRHLGSAKCFSGTTILGDGRVAMILDAPGMAGQGGLRFSEIEAREARRRAEAERKRKANQRHKRSVVLFTCGPNQYFAAPLGSVARLEKVAADQVESVARGECVQYQGAGLDLLRLENYLPVKSIPSKTKEMFLIVPRGDNPPAAVAAAQIVDIVETDVTVRPYKGPVRGLEGIGPLRGNLTLFLNIEELIDVHVRQGSSEQVQ